MEGAEAQAAGMVGTSNPSSDNRHRLGHWYKFEDEYAVLTVGPASTNWTLPPPFVLSFADSSHVTINTPFWRNCELLSSGAMFVFSQLSNVWIEQSCASLQPFGVTK